VVCRSGRAKNVGNEARHALSGLYDAIFRSTDRQINLFSVYGVYSSLLLLAGAGAVVRALKAIKERNLLAAFIYAVETASFP